MTVEVFLVQEDHPFKVQTASVNAIRSITESASELLCLVAGSIEPDSELFKNRLGLGRFDVQENAKRMFSEPDGFGKPTE